MDMNAMQKDVETALGSLPSDLIVTFAVVAGKLLSEHRAALERTFPLILELLKPHAMAAMMEQATGTLDSKEIEDALMRALTSALQRTPHAAHAG